LRILFVSSEAHPLIKTGGLADVSGSLPAALRDQGENVRLLIPGYPSVMKKMSAPSKLLELTDLPYVGRASLVLGKMPDTGIDVLAIDCPSLYQRAGNPYLDTTGRDWEDNPVRFGVLSMIAARLGCSDSPLRDWIPDIVQCNDWQTGLTCSFMSGQRRVYKGQDAYSVFTIWPSRAVSLRNGLHGWTCHPIAIRCRGWNIMGKCPF
jgi:starch synthase